MGPSAMQEQSDLSSWDLHIAAQQLLGVRGEKLFDKVRIEVAGIVAVPGRLPRRSELFCLAQVEFLNAFPIQYLEKK